MNTYQHQNAYPMDDFYLAMRNAAWEVQRNTQAPIAQVAIEMLASMSASAQGLFDVRLPYGKVSPLSLYCMIIVGSGERASEVHKQFAQPIYDFDKEQEGQRKVLAEKRKVELQSWLVFNKALSRRLTKAVDKEEDTEDLKREFEAWQKKKPVEPKKRRILRQGITGRAIMDALEGEGESIAFLSDEPIFKGGALNDMATINRAWDGAELLVIDRANGVSVEVRQPRVTIAFKAQPALFKDFMKKRGETVRGSGHWARYLVTEPISTQGSRYCYNLDKSSEHLAKFHERMGELLREFGARVASGHVVREVLEFSDDAKARWITLSNEIEAMLAPGGPLRDINDFASKMMEIIGRVAALLHVYANEMGRISFDSLERAFKIVVWHIKEAKRIFSEQDTLPDLQHDVELLEKYLIDFASRACSIHVPKNYVLQRGPLRPSCRLDLALSFLISTGRVWVGKGVDKKTYITLTPGFYNHPVPVTMVPSQVQYQYTPPIGGGLSNMSLS